LLEKGESTLGTRGGQRGKRSDMWGPTAKGPNVVFGLKGDNPTSRRGGFKRQTGCKQPQSAADTGREKFAGRFREGSRNKMPL